MSARITAERYREIGAAWLASEGQDSFEVHEPATGELLARFRADSANDVDAAVRRARAASRGWRNTPARERGKIMKRIAQKLRDAAVEVAEIESREVGKPIEISRDYDMVVCAESFEYFGSLAFDLHGEFFPGGPIDSYTVREPYGIVAGIIPFNWPPVHTAAKIAPAIAAGNVIIVKPPEQCPLTVLRLVEIIQSELPLDVVQSVTGLGPVVGAALAGHPDVDRVSFTGSPNSGKAVLHATAENLTGALLELGGKNPLVVFPDADMDLAVRGAVEGTFFNQGEACTSASRILVHQDIADEFTRRYVEATSRLVVGDGLDPSTHVGPMITRQHQERVQSYIQVGLDEGATLAYQGEWPADPRLEDGFFVPPVVFTGVTKDMRIAQEEIFGTVATILTFSTTEEAIEIANSTQFALVAGVFSRDDVLARSVAREIDAGVVFVNNYNRMFLGTPFGGNGYSGYGREHARSTLDEFTRIKSVRVVSGVAPVPEWSGVQA
jgi:acyl-CoA reductase-like NAD-dependent aldehyde dehydrogenase